MSGCMQALKVREMRWISTRRRGFAASLAVLLHFRLDQEHRKLSRGAWRVMAKLTQADLADLNGAFEGRTPVELLKWASDTFGDRVAILSAMQKAGSVVCHMASTAGLKTDVLFVDTGVQFQETLETRDRIAR